MKPLTCRRSVEVVAILNPVGYDHPDRPEIVRWIESLGRGYDSFVNGQCVTWYEGDYPSHLEPGEWLVIEDGNLSVYSDSEFQDTFTPYVQEEEIDRAISKLQAI